MKYWKIPKEVNSYVKGFAEDRLNECLDILQLAHIANHLLSLPRCVVFRDIHFSSSFGFDNINDWLSCVEDSIPSEPTMVDRQIIYYFWSNG